MSRLRVVISGEQGIGKSTIAEWIGAWLFDYSRDAKMTVDGRDVETNGTDSTHPISETVTEIEINTLTESGADFADSLLGKVEGKRFSKADAEVAHHVRRLLECGLLPVGVARRMLSKSAKARPGGDLITDPGSGMVTDRQGHVVKP